MSATAVEVCREEGHLPSEISGRPRTAISLRHAGCLPDYWLGTRDLPSTTRIIERLLTGRLW
jgi:hypothetical protein